MRAILSFLAASVVATAANAQDQVVRVYNWSDYVDPEVLAAFTDETGIAVVYDVFDSNEVLETKLLAGSTGYDLVVPTGSFLSQQIRAGVFQELDRSQLPNWANLDPTLMAAVEKYDPDNAHAFIYMWGTTGIAYNAAKIAERMPDAPTSSWDMIFKPEIISKFQDCGIYVLDAPTEILPAALHYLGYDPDTTDMAQIEEAGELLKEIRPYIQKFNNSENINALAGGDICLAVMWSGDALIAKSRAEEAGNGVVIEYSIPESGAQTWFDMMAMPADAPHPENAYKLMNYLLEPEVAAANTNYVTYPSANDPAKQFIEPEIVDNPNVYPPQDVMEKLYVYTPKDLRLMRQITRLWTGIKTGS